MAKGKAKRKQGKREPPKCPICLGLRRIGWAGKDADDKDITIVRTCFYCRGKGTMNVQESTLKAQHEHLLTAMECAKVGGKDGLEKAFALAEKYVAIPTNRRAKILETYTQYVSSDEYQSQLTKEEQDEPGQSDTSGSQG